MEWIFLAVLFVVVFILLRMRNNLSKMEQNYKRLMHEYEVELAKKRRDISIMEYTIEKKEKDLKTITTLYDDLAHA